MAQIVHRLVSKSERLRIHPCVSKNDDTGDWGMENGQFFRDGQLGTVAEQYSRARGQANRVSLPILHNEKKGGGP